MKGHASKERYRRARRAAAVLGVLVLWGAAASRPQEARSREEQLAAIRGEIARLQQRLERARREQSGLEGELAATSLDLELHQQRLAEASAAAGIAAARQAASERQVRALAAALEASRRSCRRQLTALYRFGRQGYLRLLLLLEADDDRLLPSIRLMRYLARRDREAIQRLQETERRLAGERDRLAAERQDLERWIGREQSRRRELVAARRRQAALLTRVERERRDLASRASELADKERKLARFLDLLYGNSGDALAGTPMQQFRGVLDWPVRGRLSERFGPRLDPRYHTRVPHNGIDVATTPGAEVRTVFPGKILFAAPFEGYGLTVVVHHPGRVFTLYAGLSELRKTRDNMLSLGEVVGLAANRLYFEIRAENRPEDPLSWLR